jgi:hypothetical protein
MIRKAWCMRFGISWTPKHRLWLTDEICWQLSQCRSDEARRLILGLSR